MPHLIIEYAQTMNVDARMPAMLDAVHHAAVRTGLFEESHIKVRAIPVRFYRTGGSDDPFVHVQARIHEGRTDAQKAELSEAVLSAVRDQGWSARYLTVEVVEMHKASYRKLTLT